MEIENLCLLTNHLFDAKVLFVYYKIGSKFFSTKRTLKVALKYKQMQYYIC